MCISKRGAQSQESYRRVFVTMKLYSNNEDKMVTMYSNMLLLRRCGVYALRTCFLDDLSSSYDDTVFLIIQTTIKLDKIIHIALK